MEAPESATALHTFSPFPWRDATLLTLLAVAGAALALPYALDLGGQLSTGSQAPTPSPVFVVFGLALDGVLAFVLVLLGLRLGRTFGLNRSLLRDPGGTQGPEGWRRSLYLAAGLGVLSALILIGLSSALPLPEAREIHAPSWDKALLASVGAGLREEIWFRLGVMTTLAWAFALGGRARWTRSALWAGNVLAAVLFGVVHLPQAAAIGALTLPVVAFVLMGNGVVGIVCGWLYWRAGIVAAIASHAVVDIVLKVIQPLFAA